MVGHMKKPLSQDGKAGRAPRVGVRLPRELRARLADATAAQQRTGSDIVRAALERYLPELEAAATGPPGSG